MKTVDMLAKYLNEWPCKYVRIVQGDDSIFLWCFFAGNEMLCEAIPGERLAGLTLSDDHGIGVTCHDWISAQKTEMEKKAMCLIFLALYTPKKKSDDDYMREKLIQHEVTMPG
ncbi:hypothetical protein ABR759_23190 [Escherichia coli]